MGKHMDRRRSFRIALPGDLLLWRRSRFSGDYRILDLSIGGCSLFSGPPPAFGQRFDASLHIPGAPTIELPVAVVRRGSDGQTGLCFDDVDPAVEDEIHDILVSQLECCGDRAGEVLLVHPRPEFAINLVVMLERLGHRVRVAGTPLEAIWMLEEGADSVHTAVVMQQLGPSNGRDLLGFIARAYPRIRRLLMTSTAEPRREGDDRAHAVLEGPLDLGGLRKALPERFALRPRVSA